MIYQQFAKKLKFYHFADDTNIYFESDSLDLLEKTMNKELRKVDKWLTTNRLALNVDKSHFVLFHSSSNIPHRKIRIKIRNKRVTEENDVKFLGVLLDSTLSWKPHITELSKTLSKTVGIFYKLRHYATADVLKLLYYALLYPFLIYGSSVWGMAYQSHLDKLQAIQNKCIKVNENLIALLRTSFLHFSINCPNRNSNQSLTHYGVIFEDLLLMYQVFPLRVSLYEAASSVE